MRRCVTPILAGTDNGGYPQAPMRSLGAFFRLGKSLLDDGLGEIVENNLKQLPKRDIKPLQITVFLQF